jgi:hypothetical protein
MILLSPIAYVPAHLILVRPTDHPPGPRKSPSLQDVATLQDVANEGGVAAFGIQRSRLASVDSFCSPHLLICLADYEMRSRAPLLVVSFLFSLPPLLTPPAAARMWACGHDRTFAAPTLSAPPSMSSLSSQTPRVLYDLRAAENSHVPSVPCGALPMKLVILRHVIGTCNESSMLLHMAALRQECKRL